MQISKHTRFTALIITTTTYLLSLCLPVFSRTITLDEWKELNRLGSYGGQIQESIDLEAELQKLYLVSTDAEDLLPCDGAVCRNDIEIRRQNRMALFTERNSLTATVAKLSPIALIATGLEWNSEILGDMGFPLASPASISSGFGWRLHPVTGEQRSFHQGTDLAAPAGTPVLASFSGTVIAAGDMGNLGNAVTIDSGTTRTRYGHMSRVIVSAGETVTKGQTIGYVGSTGRSTGPHLHFEVWHRDTSGQWSARDYTPSLRAALQQYRFSLSER